MSISRWQEFEFDTSPARLDVDLIHRELAQLYWSKGIPRDTVVRAIAGSLCFGVYHDNAQIGFARVISDRATFAYLADVFILEIWRGRGLARQLVTVIRAHPELQGLRRWMLVTRDAHPLYAPFGFGPLADPAKVMEMADPDIYTRNSTG
ncbi:Acetyltransferase (GNAT) domain-containing protein [Andreprevotia lacus DSM 23236]|uniref:Acetyltransferase (GNAT) domain-containing protein n=1 Tax=Andreprevotia lacus DSM 23236 TaxID=1121001 RepID=A0A1W1Y0L5_9NEIS|nr:GNAT family N-acetyltransferase [Andreprevotia lacus]SMC29696.1 Acetyltransferase (GNAT) domain-containing protein [Andreprevotia lacus DSM 23236]